jgi:AraC-like DNA-binding protein
MRAEVCVMNVATCYTSADVNLEPLAAGAEGEGQGRFGGPVFGSEIVQYDVKDGGYPSEALLDRVTCQVHRAAWVPCWPAWSQPDHVKPWYVAYMCVRGGADYVVGGTTYRVDPGDLLLLPPHITRSGRHDPNDPFHLYSVHFSARIYGVLDLPAVYRLPVLSRPSSERMAQLIGLVRKMIGELGRAEPGCLLAAAGYCAELLALLVRDAMVPASREATELRRLAPVFRLIERRHAQRLTLDELAESVHLHPAYFSSVFRDATGIPPLRYVARYRLNRVRELLLSTPMPVTEIALETGYHDPSYLDRVFRRIEGLSPSAYRRAKANPIAP